MKSKLLCICIALSVLFSKETFSKKTNSSGHHNVVKLNLFPFTLMGVGIKNFSLQYEYAFHKNMSCALQVGFMPSSGLPSSLTSADATGTLAALKFTGFSISPEFRFYPGKKEKKKAPRGFYLAPYLRYSTYTATTFFGFDQEYPTNGTPPTMQKNHYNLDLAVKYTGFGAGLMMGVQWLIKDRVSIDWWIIGAHYGSGAANITVSGASLSTILADPTVVPVLDENNNPTGQMTTVGAMTRAQLQTALDDIKSPRGTIHSQITGSAVSAGIDGIGYIGLRTGLTVGIAF